MITCCPMRERLRMMTIDDVARELDVPVDVVQQLVDINVLPHYCLGHDAEQIRIIRCDLMEFQARMQPAEVATAVKNLTDNVA